jgi:hypothetical protein
MGTHSLANNEWDPLFKQHKMSEELDVDCENKEH